jgi:dihydroorotase
MEAYHREQISIEKIVEKMAHNPAILFQIEKRGFIKKGYYADLILVDPHNPWTVTKDNILYKCGWSPFEETTFKSRITHTIINGVLVYHNAQFSKQNAAMRLTFDR